MNKDMRHERLAPLSELKDYRVAKDNPNVTGWRVVGADGEKLGEVKDLIVDLSAMRARYLSVVAERRFFDRDDDTYLLIPIGAAALDRKGKNVFLSSVDATSIGSYPIYTGGPIDADYEYAVRDNFRRAHRDTLEDRRDYKEEFDQAISDRQTTYQVTEDFYDDEAYNEERFYTHPASFPRARVTPTGLTTEPMDADQRESSSQSVEDSISTIERLEELRKRGAITEEEFNLLKRRALDV